MLCAQQTQDPQLLHTILSTVLSPRTEILSQFTIKAAVWFVYTWETSAEAFTLAGQEAYICALALTAALANCTLLLSYD